MSAHSKIGASSMKRWSSCPGSVRMSVGIPNKSSAYADEGTMAHEIAAEILSNGRITEYGMLPPDMMDAVQVYVDWVASISSEFPDAKHAFEQRLDLSHLYPGMFGTADCLIYIPSRKHLIVGDYKHGKGLAVEVIEDGKPNVQLSYYALGALEMTKCPVETVELAVIQPRCGHPDGPVRTLSFSAIEMLDFSADLVEYAKRTEDPNAPLVPGDHCRFCPAAPTCPALQNKAQALAKQEFSPVLSYDPEKLSETLHMLSTVEAWIKNVRQFAYDEAEKGRTPPGWKLVEKRATRKWRSEDEVNGFITTNDFGDDVDFYETPTLKSVAQVEKLVGKKEMAKFSHLIVAESTGHSLVKDSDKRESALRDAKSEFQVITE